MNAAALVLVEFAGQVLALERVEFEQALARGRELLPAPVPASATTPPVDEIADAHGMERRTGIPASWYLEQARRGAIPHLRAGKYVRFAVGATLEALRATRPESAAQQAAGARIPMTRQGVDRAGRRRVTGSAAAVMR